MENIKKCKKEITKKCLKGKKSCTLIIPRKIAREYGLEEPGILSDLTNENGIRQLDELIQSIDGGGNQL